MAQKKRRLSLFALGYQPTPDTINLDRVCMPSYIMTILEHASGRRNIVFQIDVHRFAPGLGQELRKSLLGK